MTSITTNVIARLAAQIWPKAIVIGSTHLGAGYPWTVYDSSFT